MAKLSNLLVMVELLKTGRKYSVKELANFLEVSERVVREYKLFLEEAGIYVDTIRGPYGGYVLRQNINFPTMLFNNEDILTLQKCQQEINNISLKEKLNHIEKKIIHCTLVEENKNVKLITENQELTIYNALSKAVKYHFKVKIKYYNLQHGESIRTIYPLGLYLFQNEWWCSSYWEEKDDMRQFHLKRIKECILLEETFEPKEINIKF